MDPKLFFGITSSIIAIICIIPYVRDILRGKTQPHIYSWLVWATLQSVGAAAQFRDGAGYGAWGLTIGAINCFLIVALSFKYGTKNITRFDLACLTLSLVTLASYLTMKNPLYAVMLVVIIDFLGFLPTFRKGWEEPETETTTTYALSGFANFLGLFALQNYTFITTFYIGSLFLSNISFTLMILLRKKYR